MTANKSIDGLTTHDAKISASAAKTRKKSPTSKPSQKSSASQTHIAPSKAQKTQKSLASAPLQITVLEPEDPLVSAGIEDLEIEVTDDVTPVASENHESKDAPSAEPAPKTQTVEDFLAPIQPFGSNDESENDMKKSSKTKNSAKSNIEPEKSTKLSKKEAKKATKAAEKVQKSDKNPEAKPKKSHKVRKILAAVTLIVVLALIGLVLWAVLWGNDIIAKITGGQGNLGDLLTFIDDTYEPLKTDANGRTNLLAFGTEGYDMAGTVGTSTHAGAQLTDSIMLISLNQDTGDIAMISLPRDLKASPTCTATGKINEIYWCNNMDGNNEEAGATALMAEVGSILGVDIQYYAHLNWGSLTSIVDILGGINVTLDEDIQDYYYTHAVYEAGVTYTLDGEQALGLARARHGTSGGDFTRGASQQKIIIGIKDKVLEKDLSITDLLGLASTLGDNLRTNFSIPELKTLAHLTWLFDFDSMRTISLWPDYMTTANLNGISYVIPRAGVGNYGTIQAFVAEQLSNDPRAYEHPTILVLNATDTAGLAGDERAALLADGYLSVTADNAPAGEYPDRYTLYALSDTTLGTAAMLTERYGVTATPADQLPASISRGYDFVLILGPSTTSTSEQK